MNRCDWDDLVWRMEMDPGGCLILAVMVVIVSCSLLFLPFVRISHQGILISKDKPLHLAGSEYQRIERQYLSVFRLENGMVVSVNNINVFYNCEEGSQMKLNESHGILGSSYYEAVGDCLTEGSL